MRRSLCAATALITVAILSFLGCHGMTHSGPSQLTVSDTGTGLGTVTSAPAGINCPGTCSASFSPGTTVVLTATPAAKTTFDGWSGACFGTEPCTLTINANAFVSASFTGPPPVKLSITFAGHGTGLVTSNPAGISCPKHCSGRFPTGSQVKLTAAAGTGFAFGGWSGACVGTATDCIVTMNAASTVTASFGGSLQTSLNHIVFLAQENRSFDHYFGALREYWAQNGFADQPIDGLPQFNIPAGGAPSNPGCVPNSLNCNAGGPGSGSVSSFHLLTACIENPSPSWNESHVDRNLNNPVSSNATMDGFVETAAHDARASTPPYLDVKGRRAMGFYDGTDLNYYYFMASSFATSDRWFSPVMTRTQPNRLYLLAATSQGHAYPPQPGVIVTAKTIFEEMQNAGLSWKIYVNPQTTGCSDTDSACLINFSEIGWYTFGQQMKGNPTLLAHVQSINQYFQDAQNGTLPNVALIEPAYGAGLDEHPTVNDNAPTNIQAGAHYVSTLINTLMQGPSWKDSAFILTFDEGGGLYDHVPPFNGDSSVPAPPNPDGIQPNDIPSGNICTKSSGPPCDFVFTGFRVPLIVVSPFSKSHYVSHTPTDYTAILKLIETRFGLPNLTNRDAWAMDMTEFFDFVNEPMATPPSPPQQNKSDACDINPP